MDLFRFSRLAVGVLWVWMGLSTITGGVFAIVAQLLFVSKGRFQLALDEFPRIVSVIYHNLLLVGIGQFFVSLLMLFGGGLVFGGRVLGVYLIRLACVILISWFLYMAIVSSKGLYSREMMAGAVCWVLFFVVNLVLVSRRTLSLD